MNKKMMAAIVVFILLGSAILILFSPEESKGLTFNDIRYGDHELNTMDIYLPDSVDNIEGPLPVMMYIHGGGWTSGDKKDAEGLLDITNAVNCTLVSINYRFLSLNDEDSITGEDILNDIHNAIQYLKDRAEEYKIDTSRMVMMGDSAGGHLSLLYSYSMDSPIDVVAVISRVGPTDLTHKDFYIESDVNPEKDDLKMTSDLAVSLVSALSGTTCSFDETTEMLYGDISKVESISPIYYVTTENIQNLPRTILAYGGKDNLVPFSQAEVLVERFDAIGFMKYEYIFFPNSWHDLSDEKDESRQKKWLNEVLKVLHEELGTELIQI